MGFHEELFPTGITHGSAGGPGMSTSIVVNDAGQEERIARWAGARRRYNAAWQVKSKDDLQAILEFYIRRSGPAYGFRFKDWLDFTTASNGQDDPADDDTQIGVGDASETEFQLIKKYSDGTVTRTRNITKPVVDTVLVALDEFAQTEGVDFTVDHTTGLVTFSSAPGNTVVVTAGCEFDVPVRFGAEVDEVLSAAIQNYDIGAVPDIPLVEIRDEGATADEFWYGGAREVALTANIQLSELLGRVQSITPDQSNRIVKMPDPTNLPMGGPYFYLKNADATYNFLVHDESDVLIATVAAGETALVLLAEVSSAKQWIAAVLA